MMLLNTFIEKFEEQSAERKVRDFLTSQSDGTDRAEFLEHFLDSVFQPIFELDGSRLKVVGFEALIRPVAGEKGIEPSHYFGTLAQDDQSFVDRLCRELHMSNFSNWAQSHEFVSINVAPSALSEHLQSFEDLREQIGVISEFGLKNNQICLELDLSPDLDAGVVYTFASELKSMGISIALEDFDADCASFSRVMHSRPEIVKFNRTWLEGNLTDSAQIDLVAGVVSAIHASGAIAHIECVESKEEFMFAIACGFNRMQGFYFAAPSPVLNRPVFNAIQ